MHDILLVPIPLPCIAGEIVQASWWVMRRYRRYRAGRAAVAADAAARAAEIAAADEAFETAMADGATPEEAMAAAAMRQKNAIIATIQRRVNAAREEVSRLRIAAVKEAKDSVRFAANKASDETAVRLLRRASN